MTPPGGPAMRETAPRPSAGLGARGSRAEAGLPVREAQPLRPSPPTQHPERAVRPATLSGLSVAAISARRLDRGEIAKVQIRDGLKRLGRRGIPERVRQSLEPFGISGLQRQ